jgi:5-methylcytosine-specific restriction enzyme subunit McrC
MNWRCIREWEALAVSEDADDNAVTRSQADMLLAQARGAQSSLRLGGTGGERILVDGNRQIRAQQVVGVLASPNLSLEILPKIDGMSEGQERINLIRMLSLTLDLTIAHGALASLGWQQYNLLEILIRLFSDKLFEAVHRGMPRRYMLWHGERSALRGRLDVIRQFTVLASSPQRIACRFHELSSNIALNQILKAAVTKLRRVSILAANQRRLYELELAFADVGTIPTKQLPWDEVILDRNNASYRELLVLAQLLLGNKFQTTTAGSAIGFCLLFEMNTLFEKYIGSVLKRMARHSDIRVTLQGPRSHALFEIGSDKKRFMTKPDIVLQSKGKPVMIIDTKWKRLLGSIDDVKHGVSQADVYQMMAYGHVYQVEKLLLLYPHHQELGAEEGMLCEHKVAGTTNTKLSVATINLSNLDNLDTQLWSLVSKHLSAAELT